MSPPRRLNGGELAVLVAIIERTPPEIREPLLRQTYRADVTGGCKCGSATVYLSVVPQDGDAVELPARTLDVEEVQFVDVRTGELGGGVLIFIDGGYLSSLEFYSYDAPFREPPRVEDLRFFPRGHFNQ